MSTHKSKLNDNHTESFESTSERHVGDNAHVDPHDAVFGDDGLQSQRTHEHDDAEPKEDPNADKPASDIMTSQTI